MPVSAEPYQGTDDHMIQTSNGLNLFWGGATYIQYGASTAIASSTTETSLFNNSVSTTAGYTFGKNLGSPSDASSLVLPGVVNGVASGLSAWVAGTTYTVRIYGSIGNTSTPTMRIRTVLKNSAGTIVYTIADSTALTMASITGTCDFEYECDFVATATGYNTAGSLTLGTVNARALFDYGTSTTARSFQNTPWASTSIDTTQTYTLDCLATWGSSSASNTITTQMAIVRVEG